MTMETPVRLRWRFRRMAALPLALAAAIFLAEDAAAAAQLDKNACAKLAQDLQNMKALDVDKLMENGPAWAAAHLSTADLGLVRQYIDLDEQMKFRCAAPSSLVHLKHLEDEDEDSTKPAAEAGADKAAGEKDRKAAAQGVQTKLPAKKKPPAQAKPAAPG